LIDDTKDPDATNDHGKSHNAPATKTAELLSMTDEVKAKMIGAVSNGKKAAVETALVKYKVSAAVRKEILG